MGRTDQGGHSAHPEMLNALLPAQIHRLAGDGLRHRQAIIGQRRLCFCAQILSDGHIIPFDMPSNAPVGGHAGLAVDGQALLNKIICQGAVRQARQRQAVLPLRQNGGINVRAVHLAGQVKQVGRKFYRLGVGQRQLRVVVQIVAVVFIPNQEIAAQRGFGQLAANGLHCGHVILGAAGDVIIGVGNSADTGQDLLLGGHLGIVLGQKPVK